MVGTRDYVNSTLVKMKPRRHRLFTRPRPMAQQHSPPYSSPSPMWFVRSSSSFPHFPLRSPSPLPSPSSSYLHRILFDCCVLSVVVVVRCRVVSLLLLKILASAGATLLSPTVRIFSSLAASPTRPQRFASTVATPPY